MDDVTVSPHFKDLIEGQHLFDEKDRLPGPDGTPGKGMNIREALPLAEIWWETKARFSMPDYGKDPHEQHVKSAVMMGLPWDNLNKAEVLRVIAHWYVHVAIPTKLEQKSTSQDGTKAENSADLREKGKDVFEILDTACTHAPQELNIEQSDGLVDAQGVQLKT